MSELYGARCEPLTPAACEALLGTLTGARPPQPGDPGPWLLAHLDGGVVWGWLDGDRWRLSCHAYPECSPPLEPAALQQARVFGPDGEVLIWRAERRLAGRRLVDDPAAGAAPWDPPYKSYKEERLVLLGNRWRGAHPSEPFSLVGDASGSCQAVPLRCQEQDFAGGRWPLRLTVRHYFTLDPVSGAARVAASRLVRLGILQEQDVPAR